MFTTAQENIIQPKLIIGRPNDRYEQEAEAVANQVMRMPKSQIPPIQRKCEDCEKEELQMKPLTNSITPLVQKQVEEEEEEVLQMKGTGNGEVATSNLQTALQQSKGGGQHLDNATQSLMGEGIGADFSKVKVHTDSNAVKMNRQLSAKAFTNGSDIYFNQGQYSPQSSEGKHLLAHELTHVVQQGDRNSEAVQCLEIDQSGGCNQVADSQSAINDYVNGIMNFERVMAQANKQRFLNKVVDKLAGSKLIRELELGIDIETLAMTSMPSERIDPGESKYSEVAWLGLFDLAPTLNIGGICVGADKLGHFFQQGYAYFEEYQKTGSKQKAEEMGHRKEIGKLGLFSGGVYSRADLEANKQGLQFWEDLFHNIYMQFDIAKYVNPNWDETINTNYYGPGIGGIPDWVPDWTGSLPLIPDIPPTHEVVWKSLLEKDWQGFFSTENSADQIDMELFNMEILSEREFKIIFVYEHSGISHAGIIRGQYYFMRASQNPQDPLFTSVSGVAIQLDWFNSRNDTRGKGELISVNEQLLRGTWGYGDSANDGGEMTLFN